MKIGEMKKNDRINEGKKRKGDEHNGSERKIRCSSRLTRFACHNKVLISLPPYVVALVIFRTSTTMELCVR